MTLKILTLKLKSGLLSELQSDTILGHFCWRLKEKSGEDALKKFIQTYQEGHPVFLLSDALIRTSDGIRFPKPLVFKKVLTPDSKPEKIKVFVRNKAQKEETYLSTESMDAFLKGKEHQNSSSGKSSSSKKAVEQSLRVSVQIDRDTFGSAQGKLFSYKPVYSDSDTLFVILLKINDPKLFEEFGCTSILKEVFLTGFGKKKSSGYGQFEIADDLKDFNGLNEPDDGNAFMVLGNYLPSSRENITPIGYEINTKYGKLGEEKSLSENPFKNPTVFFTAGSCFLAGEKRDFYGRVTDRGEISPSFADAVQFGMPFFLRFKYDGANE